MIARHLARTAAEAHGIEVREHLVAREVLRRYHGGYEPGEIPGSPSARWRAVDLARTAERYGVVLPGADELDAIGPPTDEERGGSVSAVQRGVFDAPVFVLDEGLPVYGVDRWPLVLARIAPACRYIPEIPVPSEPIEVFHDVASPYSYLGVTALSALVGDSSAVTYTPILLGALFREIGTPDVPIAAMSEARRIWVLRDLYDWAQLRGIKLHFPDRFPVRSLLAQRVLLVEPGVRAALYAAAWADDRPVASEDDVAALVGRDLVQAAQTPAIKQRLRDNTERARSIGVFGVPTFRVGDALYWGQDHLEAALTHVNRHRG